MYINFNTCINITYIYICNIDINQSIDEQTKTLHHKFLRNRTNNLHRYKICNPTAAELTLEETIYLFIFKQDFHIPPPKKTLRVEPFSVSKSRLGWHYRACIGATQAGTEEHQGLMAWNI